jgi:hypothetical protein
MSQGVLISNRIPQPMTGAAASRSVLQCIGVRSVVRMATLAVRLLTVRHDTCRTSRDLRSCLFLSRGFAPTRAAQACSRGGDPRVLRRVRMSCVTMCPSRPTRRHVVSTQDVFSIRNDVEMPRIYAWRVQAKMVWYVASRNRPTHFFISKTCGHDLLAVDRPEHTIVTSIATLALSVPHPTSAKLGAVYRQRATEINFLPESFRSRTFAHMDTLKGRLYQ